MQEKLQKLQAYKESAEQLQQQGLLSAEAEELVNHLIQELEQTTLQNESLRKAVLKSVAKQSRMSSKLRDALLE